MFHSGALSSMPAVHTFSIYASVAVALNFLLQVTLLIAVVTLDAKRQNNNRCDIICCIDIPKWTEVTEDQCPGGGFLYWFFNKIYAPVLMLYPVRVVVVSITQTPYFIRPYNRADKMAHTGPSQTSEMELFAKLVNGEKPLIVFLESSNLDV